LKTGEKLTVKNCGGIEILINEKHSEAKLVGVITVNFDQTTGNINLTNLVVQTDIEKRNQFYICQIGQRLWKRKYYTFLNNYDKSS
jgi:predicted nucleotide-binding protein (sugar kinase/HSP70/actin superfamily)